MDLNSVMMVILMILLSAIHYVLMLQLDINALKIQLPKVHVKKSVEMED